jgi:poly-gamma-glutamate synthesis protein (capsule biosynthesis protein)
MSSKWKGRVLNDVKLYPITLGFGKGRTLRGRPLLAEGELAEKIIADMARLSRPFGTEITFNDGIGVVTV